MDQERNDTLPNGTGTTGEEPNTVPDSSVAHLVNQEPNVGGRKVSARDAAEDVAGEAKERAVEVKDEIVSQLQATRSEISSQLELTFREGKGQIARQIASVAETFRHSGDEFRAKNYEAFGRYNDKLAEQIEEVAGYLQQASAQDLLRDVEGLARRQPALFFGGLFALGVLGVRFFKSSAPRALPPARSDAYNRPRPEVYTVREEFQR
jgi:hypothetical protein